MGGSICKVVILVDQWQDGLIHLDHDLILMWFTFAMAFPINLIASFMTVYHSIIEVRDARTSKIVFCTAVSSSLSADLVNPNSSGFN